MKQQTKTFTGCINNFHLGGLEMFPDHVLGKKVTDFEPDEWISFICLLHTKATKQEKEIKTLKRKLKALTKY